MVWTEYVCSLHLCLNTVAENVIYTLIRNHKYLSHVVSYYLITSVSEKNKFASPLQYSDRCIKIFKLANKKWVIALMCSVLPEQTCKTIESRYNSSWASEITIDESALVGPVKTFRHARHEFLRTPITRVGSPTNTRVVHGVIRLALYT